MSIAGPDQILDFWIGEARHDAAALATKGKLWFGKSDAVDDDIEARFGETVAALAGGLGEDWAARGPRMRLAAIIALDQFPRNMHRGTPAAFAHDRLALGLAKDGLLRDDDAELTEVEQVFFYLPLEHAENMADQALCVSLMEKLVATARPDFRPFAESTLDYARRHKAVIDRFGRFPHRNKILARLTTPDEVTYLSQPGAGF